MMTQMRRAHCRREALHRRSSKMKVKTTLPKISMQVWKTSTRTCLMILKNNRKVTRKISKKKYPISCDSLSGSTSAAHRLYINHVAVTHSNWLALVCHLDKLYVPLSYTRTKTHKRALNPSRNEVALKYLLHAMMRLKETRFTIWYTGTFSGDWGL